MDTKSETKIEKIKRKYCFICREKYYLSKADKFISCETCDGCWCIKCNTQIGRICPFCRSEVPLSVFKNKDVTKIYEELYEPLPRCCEIIKSGPRRGMSCMNKVVPTTNKCRQHSNDNIDNLLLACYYHNCKKIFFKSFLNFIKDKDYSDTNKIRNDFIIYLK